MAFNLFICDKLFNCVEQMILYGLDSEYYLSIKHFAAVYTMYNYLLSVRLVLV